MSKLILHYQQAVRTIASALQASSGCNDLLAAHREGRIPKEGSIQGIEYSFHGVGCRGIADGVEVDFDFGPSGQYDGFDGWRLWRFAQQFSDVYRDFQSEKDVEEALLDLGRTGTIERPGRAPSPHLWYVVREDALKSDR